MKLMRYSSPSHIFLPEQIWNQILFNNDYNWHGEYTRKKPWHSQNMYKMHLNAFNLTIFTNRFPKLRLEVHTHTNSATKKRTPQNGAPNEGNLIWRTIIFFPQNCCIIFWSSHTGEADVKPNLSESLVRVNGERSSIWWTNCTSCTNGLSVLPGGDPG